MASIHHTRTVTQAVPILDYLPLPGEQVAALLLVRASRSVKKLEQQLDNLYGRPAGEVPAAKLWAAHLAVKRAERRAGAAINALLRESRTLQRAAAVLAYTEAN
jgi:hypothetical protein